VPGEQQRVEGDAEQRQGRGNTPIGTLHIPQHAAMLAAVAAPLKDLLGDFAARGEAMVSRPRAPPNNPPMPWAE
jgi:hypothetical protein